MSTYDRIEDILCKYIADVPEGLVGALEDFVTDRTVRLEVQVEELQSKIDRATMGNGYVYDYLSQSYKPAPSMEPDDAGADFWDQA